MITTKPQSMYPTTATLKSARPSASGDLAQNSTGHGYYGFDLISAQKLPKQILTVRPMLFLWVGLRIPDRILQLAYCGLNFALDLLRRSFNLGPGVAGQISYVTFGASHNFVDCSVNSLLIHRYTL